MTDPVVRAADPDRDETVSRELLAQMDEAATKREHWKILLTSGMGFFTDAYDLFIIGVAATMITTEWHIASLSKVSALVAGVSVLGLLVTVTMLPEPKGTSLEEFTEDRFPSSAVALSVAESRGTRPPAA